MSLQAIPCRIAARRVYGISPCISSGLFSLVRRKQNVSGIRTYSDDPLLLILGELKDYPPVQWLQQVVRQSYTIAQNWIISAGSGTPLEQLGLCAWWKPSSWYRIFLESVHVEYFLSWPVTIICVTVFIRMVTLYLPTLLFWIRIKNENQGRPILHRVSLAMLYSSGAILFGTQYCGIMGMVEVLYPNWTTGGMLSFIDLTSPDQSFLLPTLTALCFTISSKKWIEALEMQKTISKWMWRMSSNIALYPIAACTFLVANSVPSAMCICWTTSSLISGIHASFLNSSSTRSFLCLPTPFDSEDLYRIELLNYISEMKKKRAVKLLGMQKKLDEVAAENSEFDSYSKTSVKEIELVDSEQDLLFRTSWTDNFSLRSKVVQLMEKCKEEAALKNDLTDGDTSKLPFRMDHQSFDKIVVNKK